MSDLLTPRQVADELGVTVRTVQRWIAGGRIPAQRVGSRFRVSRLSLSGLIEPAPSPKLDRLLIANRGELVVRIARTCRQLGIRSLALVPEDQARAWWTAAADEIVPLAGSYLDIDAVLEAARRAGANAIHPGYGFLAENADFAAAVEAVGMAWVGPPPSAMRALGDKAAARRLAAQLGVPVLPGYDGDDQSEERLAHEAARIGAPLLIKPSAGGGGKGMHVVASLDLLGETLARARREAAAAFGDDRLVLERYLPRPRHVEVQILADRHGHAIHLGERECSLQRRHQKVIEEAPSPAVDAALRDRLGSAALTLIGAAGYIGAGTVEFLLDVGGGFHFLEVNARLQVEHPVTELITGRDLVADQIAIASGAPLAIDQTGVRFDGHAIEARLYAEDPHAGFLPSVGDVLDVNWPQGEGIRVDSGIGIGDVIGTRYDPLLAKLIAHAPDRASALETLASAVDSTSVFGLTTNRGFLRWLLSDPDVQAGRMDTDLIETGWQSTDELPADTWFAAASALRQQAHGGMAGAESVGFRLNSGPRLRVEIDGVERSVGLDADRLPTVPWLAPESGVVVLDLDGRSVTARLAPAPTVESAARQAVMEGGPEHERITAPMPGSVLAVRVHEGDLVEAGQVLVILEAMKMENTVTAPTAGRVERVFVEPGQQVKRSDLLIELA